MCCMKLHHCIIIYTSIYLPSLAFSGFLRNLPSTCSFSWNFFASYSMWRPSCVVSSTWFTVKLQVLVVSLFQTSSHYSLFVHQFRKILLQICFRFTTTVVVRMTVWVFFNVFCHLLFISCGWLHLINLNLVLRYNLTCSSSSVSRVMVHMYPDSFSCNRYPWWLAWFSIWEDYLHGCRTTLGSSLRCA